MSDETKDPYIGEIFQDKDHRSSNRRVKIIAYDMAKQKYVGHEVDDRGNPVPFPSTRRYLAATLKNRYRKVSH